jgi:hypothetical protein
MYKYYFSILFSLSYFLANSQNVKRCYTDEISHYYKQQNATIAQEITHTEFVIQQYIQQQIHNNSVRNTITIPVVVHVIHDGDAIGVSENISEAQILSQIEVLNKDYRKINADTVNTPGIFKSLAADIEIEFCLAQRDPNGNPTTGIIRHNFGQSNYNEIALENTVKPQTIWDRNNYLNVYTARLGGDIAGILGYSSQPGFAATTDAVVVGFQYFGTTGNIQAPFNKGRTATHEVGHWLGLFHIWGQVGGCSDDDNVSDTPVSDQPYYGCPNFPQTSCSSSDMFMNYMDYTNDACMNLFTAGQKQRMRAVLNTVRNSIQISNGCVEVPVNDLDVAIGDIIYPTANICDNPLTPVVELINVGNETITSLTIVYQLNSGILQQYQWTGNLTFTNSVYITLPAISGIEGNNDLYIQFTSPNSGNDQNVGNNQKNYSFQISTPQQNNSLPFSEGFETSPFPASGWSILNPNNDRTFELSNYGGFGNSITGILFDNFSGTSGNNPKNKIDALVTSNFDLIGISPRLSFSVAHAKRNDNLSDSLIVYASNDCGSSWIRIYGKGGSSLATAPNTNQAYVPNANEWRKEVIGLSNYAIYPSVKFKFENKSDWGNFIYLDDINLEFLPSGVNEFERIIDVTIYPNPSSNLFNIEIRTDVPDKITVQAFDLLGKLIFSEISNNTAGFQTQMNLIGESKGVYFVKIQSGNKVLTRKIVLQ